MRGNLVLDLSSNFQGQLQGSAKFPKNWPLIGNREINLVTAYVNNTLFFSEILLFTVVYTPRKDVNCWWDWGNWHVGCNLSQLQSQTMGPSALSAGSTREELVVVPPGLPFVVFRATYEGSPVELSLIDPAGKTITKETAGLDPQKYLYSENPEIAEVYFAVKLLQPGTGQRRG